MLTETLTVVTQVGMLTFVVVPAVAIATARLLPIDDAPATAIILIGCVAGPPFLPKLVGLAKGDPALAGGLMVLLIVVTVGYAPLVIPLAVEGATVSARLGFSSASSRLCWSPGVTCFPPSARGSSSAQPSCCSPSPLRWAAR